MPDYVVETYAQGLADGALVEHARLAQAVAQPPVEYVQSLGIPGDEVCLHMFEAPTEQSLRRALDATRFAYDRIVEAIASPGENQGGETKQ